MVLSSGLLCDTWSCFHYFAVPCNAPLCFCLVRGVLFGLVPSCGAQSQRMCLRFHRVTSHVWQCLLPHSPAEGVLTSFGSSAPDTEKWPLRLISICTSQSWIGFHMLKGWFYIFVFVNYLSIFACFPLCFLVFPPLPPLLPQFYRVLMC